MVSIKDAVVTSLHGIGGTGLGVGSLYAYSTLTSKAPESPEGADVPGQEQQSYLEKVGPFLHNKKCPSGDTTTTCK